jgi:hypothetical protein
MVAVTDGENAYSNARNLGPIRRREQEDALQILGLDKSHIIRLACRIAKFLNMRIRWSTCCFLSPPMMSTSSLHGPAISTPITRLADVRQKRSHAIRSPP